MTLLSLVIAGVSAAMRPDASGESTPAGQPRHEPAASATSIKERSEFAVEIRKPSGPPRISTGLSDSHGITVTVACSACHTTRQPDHQNKAVGDLDEFHGGMAFSHGSVSCLSCHNSNDYDSLKLADGSRIEFTDVMTLCGQCHGPQLKDYEHGAHGGMNGYWDLTRGSQIKNNCVDCHIPHSPQFPNMQPTFKPRDRFLERPRTEH